MYQLVTLQGMFVKLQDFIFPPPLLDLPLTWLKGHGKLGPDLGSSQSFLERSSLLFFSSFLDATCLAPKGVVFPFLSYIVITFLMLQARARSEMAKVDLILVPTALHHYTVREIEAEEKTNDTASTLTLILHKQCTAEACCRVFLVREERSDTKVKLGQIGVLLMQL